MSTDPTPQPLYGQWRRPTGAGLFGLGMIGTVVALVLAVVVVLLLMVALPLALTIAAAGFLALAPMAIRIGGRTGAQVAAAWIGWIITKRTRAHLYRTGIASKVSQAHRLPGLLAASELIAVEDGRSGTVGVICLPATRHYTVVFTASADGTALVDQEVINRQVARWSQFLASLPGETGLVQAQVVIETAPDPGTRLVDSNAARVSEDAPDLARAVFDEIAATYPAGAVTCTHYVALTWRIPGPDTETAAAEVAAKLPQIREGLAGTGAVGVRPATPDRLCRIMAAAYDPDRRDDVLAAPADLLAWEQTGPVSADEGWNDYRHDSGRSRTWSMAEAPRGAITERVFARLAAPDTDLKSKRVAILYRPIAPDQAARIVERDKRDAVFNINKTHRPSARAISDLRAADQAAEEESRGAGLVHFASLATVTVARDGDLTMASRTLKAAAGEARILLRPMNGSQAASFAAALPAGIVLPDHATGPR